MHLPRSQSCFLFMTALTGPSKHRGQDMAWAFISPVPHNHDVTPS